jgi:D-psicose/D-tagatose/L-ribulose 3-epimerase
MTHRAGWRHVAVVVAAFVGGGAQAAFRHPPAVGSAEQASAEAAAPVAGFPVGWCVRARAEAFADAKRAGFEYVDLAMQDVLGLSDQDFEELAAALTRLDLRALSGYNPIPAELRLVGPDIDRTKQDAHLALVVRRAARLQLSFLIFNSGASWRVPDGSSRERAREQLVEFARRFSAAAAGRTITVLVGPLRSTDSNLLTTIAETTAFVQAVDRPNVAMMVDYSFLRIQQDDPSALLGAGRLLRHVHVGNPSVTPRAYPMDERESDYASFFTTLKRIGYRGGLSVHASTASFDADAPRAIAFLRRRAQWLAQPGQ